jgi:hypothetical protein
MISLILYTLIIIAFAVLIIRQPSIALTALICMYGLKQWVQASHPFFLQHHEFTNLVVGALIVLAVWVHHMRGKPLIAGYPKVGWLVVGLFMYAFASTFWVSRPELSLEQWDKVWPYIITQVIFMPLLIYRADEFRSAFVLLFVMGTLISILLLFTVKWEYRSIVLSSPGMPIYGNPLAPAQIAGNVAFATLFLKFRHKLKIWALLKWIVIALNLALIVKSGSRGQLIAAILLMGLALPFSQQIRSMKGWIIIAVAMSSIVSITYWTLELFWGEDQKISGPMGERWSEEAMSEAMGGRFDNVLLLMRLWFSTPMTLLFGLGNSTSYDPSVIGIYPHFVPAEILCEEGLIGFCFFVYILFLTMRSKT